MGEAVSTRHQIHRLLDRVLIVLAVLVIPAVLLDALSDDPNWDWLIVGVDWTIWLSFALTLTGIFIVTTDRRRFWRTYAPDIALVLLTPPLVPDTLQALRALRALRLLRLVIAGMRLHQRARHLTRASAVGPAAVVLVVVLLAAATAVRLLEPAHVPSIGAGLWWATSRVTAMGDGGVSLTLPASHLVEIIVVLSGLAFLSLITAAIATIFVQSGRPVDSHAEQLRRIADRLEALEARLPAME
jgi:voltage-gated potassium channel